MRLVPVCMYMHIVGLMVGQEGVRLPSGLLAQIQIRPYSHSEFAVYFLLVMGTWQNLRFFLFGYGGVRFSLLLLVRKDTDTCMFEYCVEELCRKALLEIRS